MNFYIQQLFIIEMGNESVHVRVTNASWVQEFIAN